MVRDRRRCDDRTGVFCVSNGPQSTDIFMFHPERCSSRRPSRRGAPASARAVGGAFAVVRGGSGGANPTGRGDMRYRVGIASVSTVRSAGRHGPAGVRYHVGIASVSTPPSAGGLRRGAGQGMAAGGTGPVRTVAQRAAGEPEWTRHGWPGERVPGVVRFVVCALWVRHRKLNGREPSPVLPLTRPEAAPRLFPAEQGRGLDRVAPLGQGSSSVERSAGV